MRSMKRLIHIALISATSLYAGENSVKIFWKSNGQRILIYDGPEITLINKLKTMKPIKDNSVEKKFDTLGEFEVCSGTSTYRVINNYWIKQGSDYYRCSMFENLKEHLLRYLLRERERSNSEYRT